jgi:membrane protein
VTGAGEAAPEVHEAAESTSGPRRYERIRARLAGTDWRLVAKGVLRHAKEDRVTVLAGSLAYRWFLSLFPAIIALLGVTSLLRLPQKTISELVHGAGTALPPGASDVLTSALTHAHARTTGAVGAVVAASVVAIWSASSSMSVLQSSLDMAEEIPSDRRFLAKRVVAVGLILAVAVLGGAASALVVFGAPVGRAIDGAVPVAGTVFVAAWTALRWVSAVVLVMTLFAVIYWIGPNRESPRWKWLSPGALVGTAVWVVASLAFSLFTSHFGSYGRTYGAFAGVAILIFWLYVSGAAVLLGAEINAEVARLSSERSSGPAASR